VLHKILTDVITDEFAMSSDVLNKFALTSLTGNSTSCTVVHNIVIQCMHHTPCTILTYLSTLTLDLIKMI
jgi:hypothetical protein